MATYGCPKAYTYAHMNTWMNTYSQSHAKSHAPKTIRGRTREDLVGYHEAFWRRVCQRWRARKFSWAPSPASPPRWFSSWTRLGWARMKILGGHTYVLGAPDAWPRVTHVVGRWARRRASTRACLCAHLHERMRVGGSASTYARRRGRARGCVGVRWA